METENKTEVNIDDMKEFDELQKKQDAFNVFSRKGDKYSEDYAVYDLEIAQVINEIAEFKRIKTLFVGILLISILLLIASSLILIYGLK